MRITQPAGAGGVDGGRDERFRGLESCLAGTYAQTATRRRGAIPDRASLSSINTRNVVVTSWTGRSIVPYATGGAGGLTMFERPELSVTSDETFFTWNVGGGVKWYAPNNRWGIRGDYRFGATKSKDTAPSFFGRDTRSMHRAYAAVIINSVR